MNRGNLLLLVGIALTLFGGALFLQFFANEPAWAEWIVGPIAAFVGVGIVVISLAVRYYNPGDAKLSH